MGNMFDTTQKDVIVRESKEIEVKSMVEINEALDPPDNLPPIYLPTDILINIFSRLSVKILCNSKCVSKEWHQEFLQLPKHCGQSNEQSVGFGFLESRKEYRIASLLSRLNSDDTELWCEIFDLKEGEGNSGSWRDAGKCPFRIFEISYPACVNGVIYWLARDKDHLDNKILMISLDLEKEKFNSVRYPDHISSLDFMEFSLDQLSLVELKGCLCLVDNSSENLITDVWTLKDSKNQTWFKEYSIAFGTLVDSVTVCCNPMDVRDGEILLEASPGNEGRQGRLYFYNIEKKTFRTTEDIKMAGDWLSGLYFETFFSLLSRRQLKSLCGVALSPYDAPLYVRIIRPDQRKLEIPLDKPLGLKVIDSYNGLLLFSSINRYQFKEPQSKHTRSLKCNGPQRKHYPSSNACKVGDGKHEFLQVPKHCGQSNEQSVGFGFLESRKEYRIASLLSRPNSDDTELWCEIFDLKEGEGNSESWRDAGKCPFRIFEISYPACVNGVIYWLARDKDHLDNKILMISLDLEKEKFSSVRYPDHISSLDFLEFSLDQLSLVELKGCLCLVDNSSENLITDVWTLKDAKNQTWFKEYSIDFGTLDDSVTVRCNPMDVRDGEILLEASPGDEGRQGRLYFYNIEKKTFRTTEDIEMALDWLSGLYFETFFSLRSRRQLKSLRAIAPSPYDAPVYAAEITRLDQRKLASPLSCNGLLLLCSQDHRNKFVDYASLYIRNPMTSQKTVYTPRIWCDGNIKATNSTFHPLKSVFYKIGCVYNKLALQSSRDIFIHVTRLERLLDIDNETDVPHDDIVFSAGDVLEWCNLLALSKGKHIIILQR
ncbi:hypothetical protein RJ640_007739 [Escallonia rubra]|uniref:F-box associated beta-propeller type 3 domain-containing protein n=1 Tax=Escallonia rubra TaxID=112253 RepID=A0AA88U7L4_9ASTE|nr:hypothetical protein RJ640_007739 [Escallonia rubra]